MLCILVHSETRAVILEHKLMHIDSVLFLINRFSNGGNVTEKYHLKKFGTISRLIEEKYADSCNCTDC